MFAVRPKDFSATFFPIVGRRPHIGLLPGGQTRNSKTSWVKQIVLLIEWDWLWNCSKLTVHRSNSIESPQEAWEKPLKLPKVASEISHEGGAKLQLMTISKSMVHILSISLYECYFPEILLFFCLRLLSASAEKQHPISVDCWWQRVVGELFLTCTMASPHCAWARPSLSLNLLRPPYKIPNPSEPQSTPQNTPRIPSRIQNTKKIRKICKSIGGFHNFSYFKGAQTMKCKLWTGTLEFSRLKMPNSNSRFALHGLAPP